ncbi:MAG: ATP-binding cassette domain-containing protein, partial [Actinobacteria bacterium]|nr:ATP-binding cassette domain-containing protein [Actinomycetota bacterium]
MNNQKIIEVKNLCYKYLTSRRLDGGFSSYKEVLKGINFSVGRGEKLSIIGPNGAGKSTLMLNIAGLMDGKCRTGEIFIYGKKLNEKNIYDIREKI